MNSNIGGLNSLVMDLTVLPNQKHDISSKQIRILTPLEIELLQKDKRDSFEKMQAIMKSAEWLKKTDSVTGL